MQDPYDACIVVEHARPDVLRGIVEEAVSLGYKGLALCVYTPKKARKIESVRRKLGEDYGIDISVRLELRVSRVGEAKKLLSKYRRRFELISMTAAGRSVTAFASRDRRIDIITVPTTKWVPLYRGDWRNVEETDKLLELRVYPLLVSEPYIASRVLSLYLSYVRKAPPKARNRFILSSGAPSPRYLCTPHGLESIARELGLGSAGFVRVREKVSINRDKIRGVIPVSGVKILVRGGGNA